LYDVRLPVAYRSMVEAFGHVDGVAVPYRLLGLSDDRRVRPTSASILAELRLADPEFPSDLLPVEVLPESQIACIHLNGSDDPPVVLIDVDRDPLELVPVAQRYSDFCFDWLTDVRGMDTLLRHTRNIDRAVREGRRPADKTERPDDWRAYRFCSQDVLVGAVLLRHNRDDNVTEIAALPCATLTSFADDAPIRALLALVFADSYRSGGDLSLQFVTNAVRDPRPARTPGVVVRFARKHHIRLGHPAEGYVDPEAGRRLFVEAVACPDGLRSLLRADATPIDAAAVCFAISSGTWDPIAAEYLVRNAHGPRRLFRGAAAALDSAVFTIDQIDACHALLLSHLARRIAAGPGLLATRDTEDTAMQLDTEFTDHGTVRFSALDAIATGWAADGSDIERKLIEVVPLYGDAEQLADRIPPITRWLALAAAEDFEPYVLVPRDAEGIPAAQVERILDLLDEVGVGLFVAPVYTTTLEFDAGRRIEHARTSRQ
jgi:hypothetical protein